MFHKGTMPTDETAPLEKGAGVGCEPGREATPRRSVWQRWRRRLLVAAVLVAVLVVFHAQVFRFLAGLLVVDDPLVSVDAAVIGGRSGPFQTMPFADLAELYHEGYVREIVLIEDRSSRLVQAGILPPLEVVFRTELANLGVPNKALSVLPGEYATAWDSARRLRDWLEEHPEARVIALCDEFGSRTGAHITRKVMGPTMAARVRWRALPNDQCNTSNWWRSRRGVVELFGAYISLAHTYLAGEPPKVDRWDPEEYERMLGERQDP